jgi:hypothetical protein
VPSLREWLEANGLGQYSATFVDHDIDFDVLADLSDADLERLGLSLGHRRRLQRAIAARRDGPPMPPAVRAAPSGPAAHEARDAERRQVTVMFCDLVGSTELANAARAPGRTRARGAHRDRDRHGADRRHRRCWRAERITLQATGARSLRGEARMPASSG